MAYYPRRNRYKRDDSSYERNDNRYYNDKRHNYRNFKDNDRDDRNNPYRDDYKNDSYNSFSNNKFTRRNEKYSDYDKYERKPKYGNSNYDRRNSHYKTYYDKSKNNYYDKNEKYYREKHDTHTKSYDKKHDKSYDKYYRDNAYVQNKPTFKYFTDFNKVTNEFNKPNDIQMSKNNKQNSYLINVKNLFEKKQKAIFDLMKKIENMPKPMPKVVTNTKENSLVLSHLSCYTTEEDVYELLVKKGITLKLSSIVLMMDRQLGLCKGVGFINCYNFRQAQNVFDLLQNESIKEYPFYIDFK